MEERQAVLREMKICRFCLTEKEPLSNIYERDNKNAIPLPLQIMACVTIEVFANDGMPQLICDDCRLQTRKSYSFKTTCKKSDDALKLYLATGILNKHEKEEILQPKTVQKRSNETETTESAPVQKRPKSNNIKIKETEEEQIELKQEKPEPLEPGQIEPGQVEPGQIESPVTTEIINSESLIKEVSIQPEQIQQEDPEPEQTEEMIEDSEHLEEVDEEMMEQGEIPQVEQNPIPPKQVITHCFSCTQCERSFPLQQLLDIHMRQHTRERKFSCNECDRKFFSKHDLAKHHQIHSGVKPFICVVCNKSFSRATLLHRHEKVHISVPKYLCTYCDKTYLTLRDLDVHMATHKKKRPFKCKQCDKSFAFKQGLERHEVSHNEDNFYKCDYCEESFTTPGKLARHVTKHAGTRPYPCKLCPRTFLLSHHLSRHLKNHYTQKSMENEYGEFKCDICSMSFRRKDSLVNHTAIHSMVNLKCVICNKNFSDAQTVKEHVSTHLAGLPYPCDKCDYSFETQEELEDHEVKHVDADEEDEDEYILENNSLQVVHSNTQNDDDTSESVEETPKLRRSQRESKIKNYAEFLKDELGTDSEDNYSEEEELPIEPPKFQTGTIQPVIRSETVKVYKGVVNKEKDKNISNTDIKPNIINQLPVSKAEPPPTPPPPPPPPPPKVDTAPKSVTKITTLENLGISKQALDAMTEKSGFVEMKLGQKVIRVQKLMMTKAEYQAMSKKAKLEMKGSTVVVQNLEGGLDLKKLTQLSKTVVADPISESLPKISESKIEIQPDVDVQVTKSAVKTYVKKISRKEEIVDNQGNKESIDLTTKKRNREDITNAKADNQTDKEIELTELTKEIVFADNIDIENDSDESITIQTVELGESS